MNKKKFEKQDVVAAVWKDTYEDAPLVSEYSGKWIDEGKYQYQQHVLKEVATGKFWEYYLSQTGSHYTEYTYSFENEGNEIELTEVHLTTKTIEVWE